jgi:hypothetical protein
MVHALIQEETFSHDVRTVDMHSETEQLSDCCG